MQVNNVMTKRVVSVQMDDTLHTVKNIFDNASFHHLLVVEHNKVCGVVSDRDLLKGISPNIGSPSARVQDEATLNKRVHQIMSRKLVSILASADVYQAISLFNQHRVSCLPVVDEQQAPVGILSWRDIFNVIESRRNARQQAAQ